MDKDLAARGDNYAIASLALGVTAVMLALLFRLGLVCAILSVCFAGKAKRLGCTGKVTDTAKIVSVIAIVLASVMVLIAIVSTVRGCMKTVEFVSCAAENIGEYVDDPEAYVQQMEQKADSVFSLLRGCYGG
ncbi:MAG: hypothetical protein E7559_10580 [Ruminococcaceae bacterium]|nr:hypothetical protein [Oscillospiraceae bacterium]